MSEPFVCYVCRTSYSVHTKTLHGRTVYDPGRCPACRAPVQWESSASLALGDARTLLLILASAPRYVELYKTADKFLRRQCLSEEAIERIVSVAEGMDYEQWLEFERSRLVDGRPPTPAWQEMLTYLPALREQAGSGLLSARLHEARDAAKASVRAMRARYLAEYHRTSRKLV